MGSEPSPFSNPVEQGLESAGLPREMINRRISQYVHDNGYVFAMPEDGKYFNHIQGMAYPGGPDEGYRWMSCFATKEGSAGLPLVSIEHFYRLIDLEAGKAYPAPYISMSGAHVAHDVTAEEGNFYAIIRAEREDIRNMSDEEILHSENAEIGGRFAISAFFREEYQPGYVSETDGHTIEATDDPRVIRHLEAAVRCLDATEKIMIGWGHDLQHAESGDKILFKKNKVVCISKERLESGKTRLVNVNIGHDAVVDRQQRLKSKAPKPKIAG